LWSGDRWGSEEILGHEIVQAGRKLALVVLGVELDLGSHGFDDVGTMAHHLLITSQLRKIGQETQSTAVTRGLPSDIWSRR